MLVLTVLCVQICSKAALKRLTSIDHVPSYLQTQRHSFTIALFCHTVGFAEICQASCRNVIDWMHLWCTGQLLISSTTLHAPICEVRRFVSSITGEWLWSGLQNREGLEFGVYDDVEGLHARTLTECIYAISNIVCTQMPRYHYT